MSWTAPEDQRQRDQAIEPRHSLHLEAPAGSGKTTVLMKRYLVLLGQVREPEEILALTFTRKAAGELRARIQAELMKRAEPGEGAEVAPHEAELRDLALAAGRRHADLGMSLLERLQVNTFHGFCAQLLRAIPHEAALPPDFGLLEEVASKRLQQEAVALVGRRLEALPSQDPVRQALVRRLVRLNNNWPRLAGELQGLLARRDIISDFIRLARESRDPAAYAMILRNHLAGMILPRLTQLAEAFRQAEIGRRWAELYGCLTQAGASLAEILPEVLPGASLEDLGAWREIARSLLTSEGNCYRSFRRPKFPKGFKDVPCARLVQELSAGLVDKLNYFRELSPILLPADEVAAVQDLIIVLHQTLAAYEELCAARRSLDFTGLEQVALNVLQEEHLPEVYRGFDNRLRHLLVDEFQDTSVNQMHLLCRLLAGWQGEGGRSLMVVGDPKQSIYGWRQARLELFFQTREAGRLPDCHYSPTLQTLTLTTNFRSSQTLVAWSNEVFGQTIMADREEGGVDFKAAAAKPGAEAGSPPQLCLFTGPEARQQEADWLAGQLVSLQDRLAPAETVGVLLFTRTHLARYLEAWRRAGLSLRVKDGLPLAESLAVQHLHNLATALVRPHDDVAWAALLRGWAGAQSLGLLAEIARRPGKFWSDKIRDYAGGPGCPPEVAALSQGLAGSGRRVGREPLERTLTDCLVQLKGWDQIAGWEGPQGVANGRAYLDLLAAASAATPEATLIQAEDLLHEAFQPPDPRAQDSRVEVLTVHAAKGLEYDHVFLPFMDWQPLLTSRNEAPFLLEEVAGTGTAVIALNRAFGDIEQSVLYQTLKATARQRALGEARRLFYVAVTRARKRLWLSGVIKQNKGGDWKFPPKSPLGWLTDHYGEAQLPPGLEVIWGKPRLRVKLMEEGAEFPAGSGTPGVTPHPGPRHSRGVEIAPEMEPYEILPEPWPYELRFPSQLAVEALPDNHGAVPKAGEAVARIRGDISHRLLEILSRGGTLPEPESVAPALQWAAGSPVTALQVAGEILAEIRACQADPFLARLLSPDLPVGKSEWLVEAWHGEETLYRGQIDRLVFDGEQWWLLDYKTSRPTAPEDWAAFIASEVEKYRPQLLAYREMAARFFGVEPPESIKAGLYFTAGQRYVIL